MSFISILALALALSVDSMVISVACGMQKTIGWKKGFLISLVFAFMQGALPLLGALIGGLFKNGMQMLDHWIAFALLAIIGVKMLMELRKKFNDKETGFNMSSPIIVLGLAVATSIDAFVVGIGLGIEMPLFSQKLRASLVIMGVTFVCSMLGMAIGKKNTFFPSKWATAVGGIVLILIGIKVLYDHNVFSF